MNFKKLSLVTAVGAALVGCGADDQAYEYVDKDINQSSLSSLTGNAPIKVGNCSDCYEIPLEGIWMFQQTFGDVTRTSDVHPYMYDFLNEENLVTLKFTQEGLVAEKLEGDITFEGEITRFPGDHNEPRLLTLEGSYEAYQCKEDSYGDCTNKEEEVSDPAVRWWQKTHFTPSFDELTVHDDQTLFKAYFDNLINKNLTHVEFDPKKGVINIEFEHNIVSEGDYGEPEKNTVFYSLVRLDTIASPGYQPVHYDLAEHDKFGFFKTDYKKLDPNNNRNQRGYEGHFINRFNPEKEKIEYYLSDEFFRKDENGNLLNKQWLDATIRGFSIINNSLKDDFSKNNRIVPELVLVNAGATEPSGVRVGDLRKNVIHIVPEASDGGGGGLGPSYANPLTGEIVSAYTIMFPGNLIPGTGRQWDTLARHYNKGILEEQLKEDTPASDTSTQGFTSNASSSLSDVRFDAEAEQYRNEFLEDLNDSIDNFEHAYDEGVIQKLNLEELQEEKGMKLAKMVENNIYPVDQYSVSTSIKKTNVTDLDFISEGFYFEQTQDEIIAGVPKQLKSWADLSIEQREAVTRQISTHYYLHVLTHEIGHNLGLRHNFAGSYDGHNFYSAKESLALGLNGLSATSSVMDYMPSSLNSQPAFGLYDRAALRFAYQRKVESHEIIDENSMSDEEVANKVVEYRNSDDGITMIDLSVRDEAKRADLTKDSALASIIFSGELDETGKELRDYAYCTDGSGRAPVNSGCLIFDEGTNLTQITDYYSEQYTERFESFSTRKDKIEFNENKSAVSKYFATRGMFSRMNMVLTDYYSAFPSEPLKPSEVCPAADDTSPRTSVQQRRCDVAIAAYEQAFFYLDLLKTPAKTCNVDIVRTDIANGVTKTTPLSNRQFELQLLNIYAGLIAGDQYKGKLHLPTSCFDEKLTDALSQGAYSFTTNDGKRVELSFNVTAESKYGEFLNQVRLFDRPSKDNASRIGYEVEHLGNWMDKVLALEYLLSPARVRGVDFALIDLPGVREQLNELIDHWNLSRPIPLPNDVATEFSQVINPYEMVDANGDVYKFENSQGDKVAISWTPNWRTKEISVPGGLSWWFGSRYGFNFNSNTPLPKAMSQVLARYDSIRTDSYKPEAFAMRSKVAVYDYNGHIPTGFEGIEILGRTYAVDTRVDSNAIGKAMLRTIQQSDVFKFADYPLSDLADFNNRRTAVMETAIGSSEFSERFRNSSEVASLQNIGPGVEKFVAGALASFTDDGLIVTSNEWNAMFGYLFENGLARSEGSCIYVDNLCVYSFTSGLLTTDALTAAHAIKAIWLDDLRFANATVSYLSVYMAELVKLPSEFEPMFAMDAKLLEEYVTSPLTREALRLEVIDRAGFRNLVIVDEHDRVSSF
ncbi:zinc-dependent metalloprotease [Vibrio sp. SCSIO 43132]|uniref:zinc-dependent metalloprotease n=1 Tax=Vibrio sp. SCSIO 43132 TaxID=2779363 RepID=UPI001CA83841|nr:zinc-dependent metalloprotease [Vibrio sp. SCSIO 43132]UAB71594.1 zinc-dependent metalloprotease [Vibrio sp. SCSIO 43132]